MARNGDDPERRVVELYIAPIGKRDPIHEGELTGPLRLWQVLQPQRTLLLSNATDPAIPRNAEATAEWIRGQGGTAEVLQLSIVDPTDLDDLLVAIHRVLAPYATEAGSVAICPTSGTPQITEAVTLAAAALFPGAGFYQALDPARSSPPFFREQSPETVRHLVEAKQGLEALRDGRYVEAAMLLGRRARSGAAAARSGRRAYRAAESTAKALVALGSLDVDAARQAINNAPEVSPQVTALRGWLVALRPGRPGARVAWAVELGALAQRETHGGRLAEAVLRAALAIEVALGTRLREAHGVDPEDVTAAQAATFEGLEVVDRRARPWRIRGARNLRDALAHLDGPFRDWLALRGDDYDSLVEARNTLAHRGRAPSAALSAGLPALVDSLFQAFGWQEPSAVPSSPVALAQLVSDLAGAVGITLQPPGAARSQADREPL